MTQTYARKINYYETDQMGIVHHSNYIKYMEEARLFYMEKNGLSYEEIEARGVIIPVLGVDVKYEKVLCFGDEIEVAVCMENVSLTKHLVRYEIKNKKTGEIHARATSQHCFLDKNMKPIRLKKYAPDIYERFYCMVGLSSNFV